LAVRRSVASSATRSAKASKATHSSNETTRRPDTAGASLLLCLRGILQDARHERIITMLYTIAVVLVILWLLGLVTSYTIGGFIHVLLVIAIVVVLLRVISGRSPL